MENLKHRLFSDFKVLLAFSAILLAALAFFQGPAAAEPPAAEISPDVQLALEGLEEGQMVSVIVKLRGQANLANIVEHNRRIRIEKVITALQNQADATQHRLQRLLDDWQDAGQVSHYDSYWVFNGLAVTATAAVIEEIAALPEIATITADAEIATISAQEPGGPPEPNLSAIGVPALWDLGLRGQGIVVANMDTGVFLGHADLANRWRGGLNSWFDPYGQHPNQPIDLDGHGTMTMGIMVGGDASGTSIGVAPDAQWIAVKAFNDQGSATTSALHAGYEWLLDPDGNPATADAPNVVNNSWTFESTGCNLEFQLDLLALRAAGILPVFAAGNSGPGQNSSHSPGNNPAGFAVGAVDNSDNIYSQSSRGPADCGQTSTTFPDIVAPGVNVYSSDNSGYYGSNSGTSLAAPHVSGVLALLLSADSNLTDVQQESALLDSAVDLGLPGPDNDFGYGRIDALAASQSVPEAATNLALNSPVTVSSFQSDSYNGQMAADGNLNTYWKTKRANGPNQLPTEWIIADVGGSAAIDQVVLDWDGNFASDYTIQVSDDGSNWSIASIVTNGNGGTDTIALSSSTGRYVKLETTAWNNNSLRNWLQEFEIWGILGQSGPTDTPTPTPTSTPTPTPTPTPQPTETPAGGNVMHVGDLDGSSKNAGRNWRATVEINVEDGNHAPLANVLVGGAWSDGYEGDGTCITGANGQCNLITEKISDSVESVRFNITDLTLTGFTYQESENHDPEPDSNGTEIIVNQP